MTSRMHHEWADSMARYAATVDQAEARNERAAHQAMTPGALLAAQDAMAAGAAAAVEADLAHAAAQAARRLDNTRRWPRSTDEAFRTPDWRRAWDGPYRRAPVWPRVGLALAVGAIVGLLAINAWGVL